MDWLKRNKLALGVIVWAFTGATNWAASGCAPAYDKDVVALLHVSCGAIVFGLSMLGTFLVGGGLLTSDKHQAVKQGFKAPEGPPAIIPEAEVKRIEEARRG
jgi:hypothetical protein